MTDNEIIKALGCCILGDCQGCFYGNTDQMRCKDDLMEFTLNLVKRQKAAIARLTEDVNWYQKAIHNLGEELRDAKNS